MRRSSNDSQSYQNWIAAESHTHVPGCGAWSLLNDAHQQENEKHRVKYTKLHFTSLYLSQKNFLYTVIIIKLSFKYILLERNWIVSEREPFQKTELRWVAKTDTLTFTCNLVVFSVFGCTRSKSLERSHRHCPIEVSLPFQFNRFHAVIGSVVRW